ncbi:Thioredoxin [Aphelenchoides bicaudatus]|nr:Thioredoxin [Aphelenchoides bicaudatus]
MTVKPKMSFLRVISITLLVALLGFHANAASRSRHLIKLNEENWQDVLRGEWMLGSFQLGAHLPIGQKDLNVKVAEIDVTENPGLSGRFLVTALPTIYHVKDGVFRVYSGPRDKEAFITFVEEKQYSMIEPVPSYKNPDSPQMGVVALFFKLSMAVRDFHNHLVENVGIPSWASYSMFAVVTLGLGCILGFFIVCIIDAVFPTGHAAAAAKKANAEKKKDKSGQKGDAKESSEKKSTESEKEAKKTK